jgi:hypothetical protein
MRMRSRVVLIAIMGMLAVAGCTTGNEEYSARGDNLGDEQNRDDDRDECEADEDRDGDCVPDDCDDADANIGPSSPELADDGLDNDCDGEVDEGREAPDCAADDDCARGEICHRGLCEEVRDEPCADEDGDGFCADEDCDDNDPLINPGAPDRRDGIDNDCDGQVDEGGDGPECRSDSDCRGGACVDGECVRDIPECDDLDEDGYCAEDGDCNDRDDRIHPGAPERRDGIDNDCDGMVDENDGLSCESDADCPRDSLCFDGLCSRDEIECTDNDADGFCAEEDDCDDDDASVNPRAEERRDGLDNDCDGQVDEGDDALECHADNDCRRGEACVDGLCERR